MTSRIDEITSLARSAAVTCALTAAIALTGCGKKDSGGPQRIGGGDGSSASAPAPTDEAPARAERPRPAPQPVAAVDVSTLATDPKVQFPSAFAPRDGSLARAVADFASAIASGDSNAFGTRLDATSQDLLAMLVRGGEWGGATDGIRVVRIVRMDEAGGSAEVGIAIQDDRGAYLTGWRAQRSGDSWTFAAMPVPVRVAGAAAALDGADLTAPVVAAAPEPKPAAAVEEPDRPSESGGGGIRMR